MWRGGLVLVLALGLAACGRGSDRLPFDGQYFRASAKAVDRDNREDFEVVVRQASKSVDGAREAAAHEATAYCIRWFGRSDVVWDVDPADDTLTLENDQLTVRGTCTG